MIRSYIWLLFLVLTSQSALAEPVLIRSGVSEGQGWVFKDKGKCWVATAGHVIGKNSTALIVGPNGKQGQSSTIEKHPTADLAIMSIVGSLESACPFSSKGDRDTSYVLKRLLSEGKSISFERRIGLDDGGAFGLDIIPVEVIALSESDSLFTIRTLHSEDYVIQSDSGSPVRMSGDGVGEAGLPLGLVIADESAVEDGFITVLRMDLIRDFFEEVSSKKSIKRISKERNSRTYGFSITGFYGLNNDSACGPMNILDSNSECGWRVKRDGFGDRPGIVLRFPKTRKVTAVTIDFGVPSDLTLFSVKTKTENGGWSNDRPCFVRNEGPVSCSLGSRTIDEMEIVFEGRAIEVKSIKVE